MPQTATTIYKQTDVSALEVLNVLFRWQSQSLPFCHSRAFAQLIYGFFNSSYAQLTVASFLSTSFHYLDRVLDTNDTCFAVFCALFSAQKPSVANKFETTIEILYTCICQIVCGPSSKCRHSQRTTTENRKFLTWPNM